MKYHKIEIYNKLKKILTTYEIIFFVLQEIEESTAILPEYLSADADADAIRETLIFHPQDSESIEPEEDSAIKNRIQDESRASIISKWLPTDIEEFIKGLKKCRKDFYQIKTEYLPAKKTAEIISFYYAWKRNRNEVNQRGLIAASSTEANATTNDEIFERMLTEEKPETRTIDVSIK